MLFLKDEAVVTAVADRGGRVYLIMTYFKSLFFNFLIVFFVNHVMPGIVPGDYKLPHIGADLIFAFVLGLLNSLIYPILHFILKESTTLAKIALTALIVNLTAYASLKFAPLGISITGFEGFFVAVAIVSCGSILTNYFEMKRSHPNVPRYPDEDVDE